MAALLRDALLPNLVQTDRGRPGARARRALREHRARLQQRPRDARWPLRRADSCSPRRASASTSAPRSSSTSSAAPPGSGRTRSVLVATLRALKFHGGVPAAEAATGERQGARRGASRTSRSTSRASRFGLEPVVAINCSPTTPRRSSRYVLDRLKQAGVEAGLADVLRPGRRRAPWSSAEKIVARATAATPEAALPLRARATRRRRRSARSRRAIYGAADVDFTVDGQGQLDRAVRLGLRRGADLHGQDPPVALRRPEAVGRPRDFEITVREVRLSAGAGFLVPLTGEIIRCPACRSVPTPWTSTSHPTADHRRRVGVRVRVALTALGCVLPLWTTPAVPTQDGPSHVYNAWVIANLADAELGLARHFEVVAWAPNWGGVGPLSRSSPCCRPCWPRRSFSRCWSSRSCWARRGWRRAAAATR